MIHTSRIRTNNPVVTDPPNHSTTSIQDRKHLYQPCCKLHDFLRHTGFNAPPSPSFNQTSFRQRRTVSLRTRRRIWAGILFGIIVLLVVSAGIKLFRSNGGMLQRRLGYWKEHGSGNWGIGIDEEEEDGEEDGGQLCWPQKLHKEEMKSWGCRTGWKTCCTWRVGIDGAGRGPFKCECSRQEADDDEVEVERSRDVSWLRRELWELDDDEFKT